MPTVLITGTSTGIGLACTSHLAAKGWTVYAGVRRLSDAEQVGALPGDVRPVICDVAEPEQIADTVARISNEQGGRLDALVNNAGIATGGPVETMPIPDWRDLFEVNLFGPVALTREAFGLVRAAKGRFVFIGSISGRTSSPLLGAYSASKHALEAVAEALLHEVAPFGVHVSLIEPGQTRTPMMDKGVDQVDQITASLTADEKDRYAGVLASVEGFLRTPADKMTDPAKVAAAVEHALTARRPKARYLVGPDAKVAGHVITRLPDVARTRVLALGLRQYARTAR